MKKLYIKPSVEVDIYSLDTSIASHCGIVVSNGPEVPGKYDKCSDYDDPFSSSGASIMSNEPIYNIQFYEETNCDCYTSGGDYGYWTS